MPEYRDTDMRKLPQGAILASHESRGFHVNLLANCLTNKLKLERIARTHANGDSVATRVAKSIQARQEKRRQSQNALRADRSAMSSQRPGSEVSEITGAMSAGVSGRKVRVDSARSAILPDIASNVRKMSRRSNSASPVVTIRRSARRTTPSERSQSDLAFLYGSSASEASGPPMTFEPRGPGRCVMVVKKDGVFQPRDKYAPPRQITREVTPARKSEVCNYELYQVSCDTSESGDTPREGGAKRGLKVSWSKAMTEVEMDDNDCPDGPLEECTAVTTPASVMRRTISMDNFAFRRPVYSKGKSKVACIGVKWTVPDLAKNEEKEVEYKKPEQHNSKPMWSYLVTPELTRLNTAPRSTTRQSTSPSKSRGSGGRSAQSYHMPDKRLSKTTTTSGSSGHCRDVHPVSTAMNRQGTSVSKTKWTVPSSTSSTFEAERAILNRLELVKKPGGQLLYECPPTLRDTITEYAMSRRAHDLLTQNTDHKNVQQSGANDEGKREEQETEYDASTYSSLDHRDDETPSPTKSRMT